MKTFLILTSVLFSSSAMAHTGHMTNESVHGLLHIEHIIALVCIGIIAVVVKKSRHK